MEKQTDLFGKELDLAPEEVNEKCTTSCYYAKNKPCVCKCEGAHHGKGVIEEEEQPKQKPKKLKPFSGMYVCEYELATEDPKHKGYSMTEVDIYAWIPSGSDLPNHRLTLWKNLKTGNYEIIRVFQQAHLISKGALTILTNTESNEPYQVAFSSPSLQDALNFENAQWRKYHGKGHEDRVCTHKYPEKATFCDLGYEMMQKNITPSQGVGTQ